MRLERFIDDVTLSGRPDDHTLVVTNGAAINLDDDGWSPPRNLDRGMNLFEAGVSGRRQACMADAASPVAFQQRLDSEGDTVNLREPAKLCHGEPAVWSPRATEQPAPRGSGGIMCSHLLVVKVYFRDLPVINTLRVAGCFGVVAVRVAEEHLATELPASAAGRDRSARRGYPVHDPLLPKSRSNSAIGSVPWGFVPFPLVAIGFSAARRGLRAFCQVPPIGPTAPCPMPSLAIRAGDRMMKQIPWSTGPARAMHGAIFVVDRCEWESVGSGHFPDIKRARSSSAVFGRLDVGVSCSTLGLCCRKPRRRPHAGRIWSTTYRSSSSRKRPVGSRSSGLVTPSSQP